MEEWQNQSLDRRPLRLKEFDYGNPNYVYFLTICARHLSAPFYDENLAQCVIDSLSFIRENKKIPLYCYCLMPDHLHIALSPSSKSGDVPKILQSFKSYTTKLGWQYGVMGKLWQRNYYDHIARKDEDLLEICKYILDNPVRKGLVEDPNEWKYSGMIDSLPT